MNPCLQRLACGLTAAAASCVFAGSVQAGPAPTTAKPTNSNCFFSSNWEGWKSPTPDVIYLRVNMHDIYKLDLQFGSNRLNWPDSHLVNLMRGSNSVCTPLDLDLSVSDSSGFPEHLFIKALTKLTPDQVAAIPRKDLP
jgi:hypothetical protein